MCGSLPPALAARGHRVMVVAPRYADYDVTPVDQVSSQSPCSHSIHWCPHDHATDLTSREGSPLKHASDADYVCRAQRKP